MATENYRAGYVMQKLKDIEDRVDNSDKRLGLDNLVHNPDAEKLLSLSQEDLDKMTADECAAAKYTLAQHALVIQKTINRATSLKNWAERNIRVIMVKDYGALDSFTKYEVRRQFVIKDNNYAQELDEVALEQELKIDNLSYIAQAITNISNSFQLLYNSKKYTEPHE